MAEEPQEEKNNTQEEEQNTVADTNAADNSDTSSENIAERNESTDKTDSATENKKSAENNIKPVPLFSEETADFLMRMRTAEDIEVFMEGQEYSFMYLSKKFLLPVWDQYCDNFTRLILPVIFFSVLEAAPAVILILSGSNLLITGLFTFFILAPMHIARNLFFIKLLSGADHPFLQSIYDFKSLRFYINSLITASAFAAGFFSGLSLMLLPGYLFYILFSLSMYFAADEKLSLRPAFKLAFAASRGYRFFIGTVFIISAVLQSVIPGIFAVEIAGTSIHVGFAPQLWNIVGFSIFTLVLAPMIHIINTGIYLESKISIFNSVSRILNRTGAGDHLIISMKGETNEDEAKAVPDKTCNPKETGKTEISEGSPADASEDENRMKSGTCDDRQAESLNSEDGNDKL